jgi:hypothetical protein
MQQMKFFVLFIAFLFSLTAGAQIRWNLFAGPQATTARYRINDIKQNRENKIGFQAGAGAKVPFEGHLYFSPAIFYSSKGYKVTFNRFAYPPDAAAVNNNTRLHTVETAFLLQYDLNLSPSHTFIKAGPSLDFQLSGREKFKTNTNTTVDRKMKFSYGDYGHYSANILVQMGYESEKGFIIYWQYTYGLGSINNFDDGPRIRHRAFGLSLGKFLK